MTEFSSKDYKNTQNSIGEAIYGKVKIFGIIAITGFLILLVSYGISWHNQLTQNLQRTAKFALLSTENSVLEAKKEIISIGSNISTTSEYKKLLHFIADKRQLFTAFFLVNHNGTIIFKKDFFSYGKYQGFLSKPWQKTLEKENFFISNVTKAESIIPSILFATPVNLKDGNETQTLLCEFNTVELWKKIMDIELGKNGGILITDKDGSILFDKKISNLKYNKNIGDIFKISKILEQNKMSLVRSKDGFLSFVFPIESKISNWTIIAYEPLSSSIVSWTNIIAILLFFGLISVLFSIFWIDKFIINSILTPLSSLRKSVSNFQRAEFGKMPKYIHKNELIALSRILDIMVSKANSLIASLYFSEKRFRSFFEESQTIMLLTHQFTGKILDFNEAALNFYGYTKEQLHNMSLFDLSASSAEHKAYSRYQSLLKNKPFYQTKHKMANGDIKTVELQMNLAKSLDIPINFVVVIDKSSIIFSKQDLHNQYFFDSGPIIFIKRMPQKGWPVAKISKNIKELLGYDKDELLANDFCFKNIIHPDDLEKVANEIVKNTKNKKTEFELFYRIKHKNGKYIWYQDFTTVLYTPEGKAINYSGYLIDQTSFKDLEDYFLSEEEKLKNIVWATGAGVWEWRTKQDEFIFDERCAEILGFKKEEVANLSFETWRKMFHPLDFENSEKLMDACLTGERDSCVCEARIRNKEGIWVWTLIKAKVSIKKNDITDITIAGTMIDISTRKEAEFQLKLAASVFSYSREGITITDENGIILDVNDAFARITGYSRYEALGQNPNILKSGRHSIEFYKKMWSNLQKKGYWRGEIWNKKKTGEIFPEILTISAVTDSHNNISHYVAIFSDISDIKEQQAKFEHLAHHDSLTNLPNRVLFTERLKKGMQQAKANQKSLVVVYLDLDGFKAVNDTYGHELGDKLLVAISLRMSQVLRDGDTVARLGGDEFAIIMMNVENKEYSDIMFNRLLHAVSQETVIDDKHIKVSASIGATFYPQDKELDSDQLLRQADWAMYQAKLTGKNKYYLFDIKKDEYIKKYHETLHQIEQALDNNEFFLVFQPKVNMKTGKILGFEALLRWNHPIKGLLYPKDFLSYIENDDLMRKLSMWVVETSLSQQQQWGANGFKVPISINIAAMRFQMDNCSSCLNKITDKFSNYEKGDLVIEITDSGSIEKLQLYEQTIEQFSKSGVLIALDDFGASLDSLDFIKNLPIQELKTNRKYVIDMLNDPYDFAMCESILAIAHAFGKNIVAKGLHTQLHIELALRLGYEIGQGFGISKPLEANEVIQWAKNWAPNPAWSKFKKANENSILAYKIGIEHRNWILKLKNAIIKKYKDDFDINKYNIKFEIWLESLEKLSDKSKTLILTHQEIYNCIQKTITLCKKEEFEEAKNEIKKTDKFKNKIIQFSDAIF